MSEPWYIKSFKKEYLELYAHRTEEEAYSQVHDMLELLKPNYEGPTLDLCCGAGRHLKALQQLGMKNLTGIDLSTDLLSEATKILPEDIKLIQSDMREIPFENYFSNIFSMFTSFGYFEDDSENYKVIEGIYKSLKPTGKFLMDFLNEKYVRDNLIPFDSKQKGDLQISNTRTITTDGKRVEKETKVLNSKTDEELILHESVRLFTADELKSIFNRCGFENIKLTGDLEGNPYSHSSPRMIFTMSKS
jgi:SAM-dependent methyltransferase